MAAADEEENKMLGIAVEEEEHRMDTIMANMEYEVMYDVQEINERIVDVVKFWIGKVEKKELQQKHLWPKIPKIGTEETSKVKIKAKVDVYEPMDLDKKPVGKDKKGEKDKGKKDDSNDKNDVTEDENEELDNPENMLQDLVDTSSCSSEKFNIRKKQKLTEEEFLLMLKETYKNGGNERVIMYKDIELRKQKDIDLIRIMQATERKIKSRESKNLKYYFQLGHCIDLLLFNRRYKYNSLAQYGIKEGYARKMKTFFHNVVNRKEILECGVSFWFLDEYKSYWHKLDNKFFRDLNPKP